MSRLFANSAIQCAIAVVASMLWGLAAASPVQYDYSYQFANGTSVSGTLIGEENGSYLEHISAVTMSVNGAWRTGQFNVYGRGGPPGSTSWQISVARIAFDGSLNNLLFATLGAEPDTYIDYFYYQNTSEWCGAASCTLVSIENPHFDASDVGASPASWELRASTVPEPGMLALLALGLAGLGYSRRKVSDVRRSSSS